MITVHKHLDDPEDLSFKVTIRGDYRYWHYGCDGCDDRGWGCGYRTLQTICSWMIKNLKHAEFQDVPSIPQIQELLVKIGDKEKSFIGSREWIGSYEVFLILDELFEVSCKIQHVRQHENFQTLFQILKTHFEKTGSPVMMGGDIDASSKGIFGVAQDASGDQYLLVVDPHYWGKDIEISELVRKGWVQWTKTSEFLESSFYNLCLPQV